MDLSMCRICLADDVRMESILDTYLQETFEKLTEIPFETKKSRPLQLCYICCAKLRNCHQLQVRCLQSEELFQQMLTNNVLKSTASRSMRDTLQSVPPVIIVSIVPPEVERPFHDEHMFKTEDCILDDQELKEETLEELPVPKMAELPTNKKGLQEPSLENKIRVIVKQDDNNIIKRMICIEPLTLKKVDHDPSEVNENTNKKPHTCDVCGRTFRKKPSLQSHIFTHTGDSPYKCDICGKYLSRKNLLMDHMRVIHNGEKPFKCDICLKCFSRKHNLNTHVRLHTGERPYKCGTCDKDYTSRSYLSIHMRTHSMQHQSSKVQRHKVQRHKNAGEKTYPTRKRSATRTKPYKCDLCEKFYSTKLVLKNHIRFIHMGEKLYKCNICEKSYAYEHSLNIHINSHTGYKPYQCHLCPKAFTQNPMLQSHLSTHTNASAYKCEFCSKCLSTFWALKEHVRVVHVGEKPYKCIVCDRYFGKHANLRSHIRKHTGEKPFPCKICNKYYRYQCDLIKHVRIHTGEKPYKCEVCNQKFAIKKKLIKHVCADYIE